MAKIELEWPQRPQKFYTPALLNWIRTLLNAKSSILLLASDDLGGRSNSYLYRWFVETLVDLFFNTNISLIRNPYFPANRQSDENPRWSLVSSNIFLIILSKKRKIFSICVRYQISKDAQDFDGFRFPFFSTSCVAMAATEIVNKNSEVETWNQSAKPDRTLIQNRLQ